MERVHRFLNPATYLSHPWALLTIQSQKTEVKVQECVFQIYVPLYSNKVQVQGSAPENH